MKRKVDRDAFAPKRMRATRHRAAAQAAVATAANEEDSDGGSEDFQVPMDENAYDSLLGSLQKAGGSLAKVLRQRARQAEGLSDSASDESSSSEDSDAASDGNSDSREPPADGAEVILPAATSAGGNATRVWAPECRLGFPGRYEWLPCISSHTRGAEWMARGTDLQAVGLGEGGEASGGEGGGDSSDGDDDPELSAGGASQPALNGTSKASADADGAADASQKEDYFLSHLSRCGCEVENTPAMQGGRLVLSVCLSVSLPALCCCSGSIFTPGQCSEFALNLDVYIAAGYGLQGVVCSRGIRSGKPKGGPQRGTRRCTAGRLEARQLACGRLPAARGSVKQRRGWVCRCWLGRLHRSGRLGQGVCTRAALFPLLE
jgi:hypothetical protein